jgi:Zn-dependent metalloprotease
VYGAQVGIHFDSAGNIITVNNTYEPDVKVDTTQPRLSRSNATAHALSITKESANGTTTSDLIIVPLEDSTFALAWRIVVPTNGPTWEVLIDAGDGKALTQPRDTNRYVNGTGQVFRINAIVATHNNSLRDDNDSAAAVPASAYSLVTLLGLDNSGNLDGVYASSSKTKKRAFSAGNSFIFDRSNDGFSETMGYYYIDYAERYIQSLGFTNVNNRQQVFAVNKLKIDNSFYDPHSQEISLGLGGVDDAEDADVIVHEYGHSIQDNQVPGFGTSLEAGSMGEGFGDYWAGTIGAQFSGGFQDLCLAEWDATAYSSTNPPCLRRLDGTKHYPEDLSGEVHNDGEIWSASLWQIREAIGATNADRTILAAHFLLSPSASFNEGANALVIAAQNLGLGNRQLNQIKDILSARGFDISA